MLTAVLGGGLTNRAYAAAPCLGFHKRNSTPDDGRRQLLAHVRRRASEDRGSPDSGEAAIVA